MDNYIKTLFQLGITPIIVAIGSLIANKITNHLSKKDREIKYKQFINVYLPLYKYIYNNQPKDLTKETAMDIYNKIKKITNFHFIYVYHNLINYNEIFKRYIDKNNKYEYQRYYALIKENIKQDYNKLANKLKYPYETKFRTIFRSDILSKLVAMLVVTYILFVMFIFIVSIINLDYSLVTTILGIFVIIFIIISISIFVYLFCNFISYLNRSYKYRKQLSIQNFIPDFSNKLLQLKAEKNLLSKDIAHSINISLRTYQRYESGDITPDAIILIKLADYFNVSVDYLLDAKDDVAGTKENH